MRHELRLFLLALQFLTRVPVPRWVGYEPAWLHASARHFPAVGLCVGGMGALVLVTALAVFPAPVAVVLSMAATVALTGAFHEDGWADTCDGLGGHAARERALEIMKDSRIGTYGAVGLVLMLGLKATALAALPVALAVPALLFGHTVSRALAVVLIRGLPYAGDVASAKAKPMAQQVSAAGTAVAMAWGVALGGVLVAWRPAWWLPVLGSAALAVLGAWACARCWRRRLGGYTGDTLGATQQVTEVLVLLAWLAWPRLTGFVS